MKFVLTLQVTAFFLLGSFVGTMHNRIVELERIKAYGAMTLAMGINQLGEVDI